jgi:hypothetical protein
MLRDTQDHPTHAERYRRGDLGHVQSRCEALSTATMTQMLYDLREWDEQKISVAWECLDCGAEGIAHGCTADAWAAMRNALAEHTLLSPKCLSEWARIFPKPNMIRDELFELHDKLCSEAKAVMEKKNQDYSAHNRDPFKNFKGSLVFDVEPEIGTMIRMQDKFMRVHAFLRSGRLAVHDEGILDIGHDLINYSVLLVGQLQDRIKAIEAKIKSKLEEPAAEIPSTVPVPNGYIMLGPCAFIQAGDLMRNMETKQWVDVPEGLHGCPYAGQSFPVIRGVNTALRYCPLCTYGAVDVSGYATVPHLIQCPLAGVPWRDVKLPGDKIEIGDKVYNPMSSQWHIWSLEDPGTFVSGRAVVKGEPTK